MVTALDYLLQPVRIDTDQNRTWSDSDNKDGIRPFSSKILEWRCSELQELHRQRSPFTDDLLLALHNYRPRYTFHPKGRIPKQ